RRRVRQAQPILEIALVLAELLGKLADGIAMFADHAVVHRRLVERGEVFPLEVLDDGDLEGRVVVDLLHQRGNRRQARSPGCAPATLAGDELEEVVIEWPDEDRLEDAMLPNGCRQLGEGLLVEREAWLFGI